MSIGRPVQLAPSSSAFKNHNDSTTAAKNSDWGLAVREAEAEKKAAAADPGAGGGGVFSKLSELVFGW